MITVRPEPDRATRVATLPKLFCCYLGATLLCASPSRAGDPPGAPKPGQAGARSDAGAGAPAAAGWKPLFDGRTLTGWQPTDFAGRGEVVVTNGEIHLETGFMTGVTWTNAAELPRSNYEISLEAMRVDGSDFFCGLTFPVGKDPCSFIVGGWGGGVVGLSSLDGEDASQNETTKYLSFKNGQWFQIRVRVTDAKIEAWIDTEKMVDVILADKSISIRPEVEASKPLGIASWNTSAALRRIRIRRL
jgi:hypothetical protein